MAPAPNVSLAEVDKGHDSVLSNCLLSPLRAPWTSARAVRNATIATEADLASARAADAPPDQDMQSTEAPNIP